MRFCIYTKLLQLLFQLTILGNNSLGYFRVIPQYLITSLIFFFRFIRHDQKYLPACTKEFTFSRVR